MRSIYSFIFFVAKLTHLLLADATNTTTPNSDYLEELFHKYGEDGLMSFEGFEHLLENLGLGRLHISADHDLNDHKAEGKFVNLHDPEHMHNRSKDGKALSPDDLGRKTEPAHQLSQPTLPPIQNIEIILEDNQPSGKNCMTAQEMLMAFRIRYHAGIQETEFLKFCPALIYQLDHQLCIRCGEAGCGGNYENAQVENPARSFKTWIFALLAVGVISVAGLICVATIPCLSHSRHYADFINLLISLAIGTLMADALLHLLPHSMGAHSDEKGEEGFEDDSRPVWMGFIALLSAFFFFLIEEMHKTRTNCMKDKKNINKEELLNVSSNVSPNPFVATNNKAYHRHAQTISPDSAEPTANLLELPQACHQPDGQVVILDDGYDEETKSKVDASSALNMTSHGHSHAVTSSTSVSSIAWMVIMGDGLHNFTDGLAIGASFASSRTVGISTSIAVLCHELPHELGDFAVLLKAGMTTRHAILFNVMSSLLCVIGVVIGIVTSAFIQMTSYIFSATAGIFIYIALVDMLPSLKNETRKIGVKDLLLQLTGISIGISLMLLIALYEHQIKSLTFD